MESRTLNSKRNIIAGVLGNFINPVFGLLVNSAVVRCFSVEYIGLIGTFNAILQILNLAELGFSTSMIVNLYKPIKENDVAAVRGILASYRYVYRIIGLIILTAGIIICPFLKTMFKDIAEIRENVYILYILFLTNKAFNFMLFAHKEALLNAAQRIDVIHVINIIIYIARSSLQLIAITVFKNIYLYVIYLMLSNVAYYISIEILSRKKFPQYYPEGKIGDATIKNVKKQVAGLTISNIVGVSRDSLNSILVTSFLGLHIAGKYSNYCMIYDTVIGFFLVTTKAIQSSIGNSIVSESEEKNLKNLTKMEFLHNIVIVACSVYMLCLYQPFMKLWMGDSLLFSNPIMILFVLYFYIRVMAEVRNAYFSALGLWWKAKCLFIIEAIVVIFLMIVLGKTLGVAGIILAPSISILTVNYIGCTNLLFREYFKTGRKEFYTNRLIYTVITLIVCSVAYYICNILPYEGVFGLLVIVLICTSILVILVPAMMFLLKKEYMKESISFIKQIFRA